MRDDTKGDVFFNPSPSIDHFGPRSCGGMGIGITRNIFEECGLQVDREIAATSDPVAYSIGSQQAIYVGADGLVHEFG